jgi:hypothetical protein
MKKVLLIILVALALSVGYAQDTTAVSTTSISSTGINYNILVNDLNISYAYAIVYSSKGKPAYKSIGEIELMYYAKDSVKYVNLAFASDFSKSAYGIVNVNIIPVSKAIRDQFGKKSGNIKVPILDYFIDKVDLKLGVGAGYNFSKKNAEFPITLTIISHKF